MAVSAAEMAEKVTLDFLVFHDFCNSGEVFHQAGTTAVPVSTSSIKRYTPYFYGTKDEKVDFRGLEKS